jgi:hypothetical protein
MKRARASLSTLISRARGQVELFDVGLKVHEWGCKSVAGFAMFLDCVLCWRALSGCGWYIGSGSPLQADVASRFARRGANYKRKKARK